MENRLNFLQEQEREIEKNLHTLSMQVGELAGKSEIRHEMMNREFAETKEHLQQIMQTSNERDNKLDVNLKCLTEILQNQQRQLDKQESIIDKNSDDIDNLKTIVATIATTQAAIAEMDKRLTKLENDFATRETESVDIKKARVTGFWTAIAAGLPGLIAGLISIFL